MLIKKNIPLIIYMDLGVLINHFKYELGNKHLSP